MRIQVLAGARRILASVLTVCVELLPGQTSKTRRHARFWARPGWSRRLASGTSAKYGVCESKVAAGVSSLGGRSPLKVS